MDMSQLDEEEKKARIQAELELRDKKRNSRIFLLLGSIFEILVSIAIFFGLFIFFLFLFIKVFKLQDDVAQTLFGISTIVSLVGGLFLGFRLYKFCANLIIEKFNMHDKLTNEVLYHYSKREKEAQKEALKR